MKIKLSVSVTLFKEGDYIVAYCPALALSSFGDTNSEAKKAFSEALNIFLEETTQSGTLEKCLLDLGWTLTKKPKPIYLQPSISNYSFPKNFNTISKSIYITA